MNIEQLYTDFGIPISPPGHRHTRPDWVNTQCCWCVSDPGHEGYHLGWNLDEEYFYCWRCGFHPTINTLSKLLGMSTQQTRDTMRQYGGSRGKSKEPKVKIRRKQPRLPSGVGPLLVRHKEYLGRRGFNPDQLEFEWSLQSTGPVSRLDHIDYKHRIIIPIHWEGQRVSFTSRDITNRHPVKYISAPKDRELIHHKDIIYGNQTMWNHTGICVEGPTDVWRFGGSAFATFGIKYTPKQVRIIAKTFKKVFIMFDPEKQAQQQAELLKNELQFRGVKASRIVLKQDPGSLSQKEAKRLIKQLM